MGKTSTEVKARYNAKAYDRLTVTVPKGTASIIKAAADERGMSVNAYMVDAVMLALESKPRGEPEDGNERQSWWARLWS